MRGTLCHGLTILMVAGVAAGQTQSSAPKSYVLDFVTAPSESDTPADRARQREAGFAGLGVYFQEDSERLPFQVTLLHLDRAGYTAGDRVFYEVAIKHVGTKPFPFPMAQTTVPFNRTHQVTRRAMIMLHINDEVLGYQLIGHETTAYSGDSLKETFVTLNPGDTVRVRGVGNWYFLDNQKTPLPGSWLRHVTVRAQLQYYGPELRRPIDDSNGIKIQLQSRNYH